MYDLLFCVAPSASWRGLPVAQMAGSAARVQVAAECGPAGIATAIMQCDIPESIGFGVAVVTVEAIYADDHAGADGKRVASVNHLLLYLLQPQDLQDVAPAGEPAPTPPHPPTRLPALLTQTKKQGPPTITFQHSA